MKIKQKPEDFRVEEVSRLEPGPQGPFSLYRLEKRGIGTLEAARAVGKRWRIPRGDVAFAGLKDTHGHTGQMLTVRGGPRRNLEGDRWKLNYLGRSSEPARRGTLVANDFRVVVRALDDPARFVARVERAREIGFPDYYDDQRFGSLRGTEGAFIAEALLRGDDEAALRLALASPDRQDRAPVRKRKTTLRDHWGAWAAAVEALPESFERDVAQALADGASFRAAYERIDKELRRLHLAAYQSHLFNEEVRARIPEGPSWPGVEGPYRFHEEPIENVALPLPVFPELPFRAGERALLCIPESLQAEADGDAVALRFRLRPGSYATMLLKRGAVR
ncbi:MAG: tRNA pseudouridine(13) synthase TruD [Planctomycetota bacterium]